MDPIEILPEYRAPINFKTGTVTYDGVARTYPEHMDFVRNELRDQFYIFCDGRDLSSDIENTPGVKPWFRDDWYHDYPSQRGNEGRYPLEIEEEP